MDPITGIGLIGAACSIASYLQSKNLDVTFENINEALPDVADVGEQFYEPILSSGGQAFVQLLVIDPDLLDDLTRNARESQQAYRDCLAQASRPQERDSCDLQAQRRICETLNRIMDRNGNSLPPIDELLKLWTSFKCDRVPSS